MTLVGGASLSPAGKGTHRVYIFVLWYIVSGVASRTLGVWRYSLWGKPIRCDSFC